MALANSKHQFKGMTKDTAKELYNPEYYFDAHNIKVISTDSQSTLAISNEKGTTQEYSIPIINKLLTSEGNTVVEFTTPSGVVTNSPLVYDGINEEVQDLNIFNPNYKIIGSAATTDFIIYITTNNYGLDAIWKVYKTSSWHIDLLYVNNLNLNTAYPPELVIRYDSEDLIKLYFTDTVNQLRHIVLTDDQVHNQEASFLNIVPEFTMSQPVVTNKSYGGLNTSGMVEYAYNLYNVNGSQTKMSAVSELQYIAAPSRGGEVNEVVGQINTIEIDNIDTDYDSIRVYSIKYNSFAQDPIINVLADQKVTGTIDYFYDDGKYLYPYSLEEFLFLGGDPIYPKTIDAKDNRLMMANYKTGNFDIDFDARAYSWNIGLNTCEVEDSTGVNLAVTDYSLVPLEHDSINPSFATYAYKETGGLGGTGLYVEYSLLQKTAGELSKDVEELKFLKSREIYRIAIEFYNELGQSSLPKWIADFKTPHGNLTESYNILEVELNAAAKTYLETQGVVGWRVLRARRDATDMTVLTQGLVNPSAFQVTNPAAIENLNQKDPSWGEGFEEHYGKFPAPFARTFDAYEEPLTLNPNPLVIYPIINGQGSFTYRFGGEVSTPYSELYTEITFVDIPEYRRQLTYIYSKLFVLNTPEVLFRENFNLETSVFLNPIGTYKTQSNKCWGKRIDTSNRQVIYEYTNNFGMSLYDVSNKQMHDYGLIGQVGKESETSSEFHQYYRVFSDFVLSYNAEDNIETRDFPKIIESGNSEVTYSGETELRFWNSLYTFITDTRDDQAPIVDNDVPGLEGVNSQGTKGLLVAEKDLTKLEELYLDGIATPTTSGLPIMELSRVLPNQYGGNSFEERKRTQYLRIGNFNDLDTLVNLIENPGDVFVQPFRFNRIIPISKDVYDTRYTQYTEIIEFPVETVIDLKNRNDASNRDWDSKFQPLEGEAHNYNSVYTQESDWNLTQDLEYSFKEEDKFPNAIIPTKVKVDNELIDSWTDILYNEELRVEGTLGPINKIITHNDNLFSFQSKGLAQIAVNPRVQTVATDGIALELGTGGILHDYTYLSTTSGSMNRYGVLSTATGLFYYDALNNSLNKLGKGAIEAISKTLGMSVFFKDNIDFDTAVMDNPFKNNGVWFIKDDINDGVLFLANTDKGQFNLFHNDHTNTFSTFLDYYPTIADTYKHQLITNNNLGLYSHYTGNYNEYYGTLYPSKITLLANIGNADNIFNTIEYRSETYKDGLEVPNISFTGIRVYNEYQDTADKVLTLRSNIFKKFRNWRITIPRDKDYKLDRMRGPWAFIELEFNPADNYKFICHNPIIHFEDATIKA